MKRAMTREEAIINLRLSQNRIGGMKKEEYNALHMAIKALEADRPIVIKAKTLMLREDFDKWAKWIRKNNENENVVVIPADTECLEAKHGDLISRADAIDAIDDAIDADSPQWAILRTKIGFLPSADAVSRKAKCCPIAETCMSIDCPVSSEYIGRPSAEAVQGEWIDTGNWMGIECSRCKCHSRYVTPFCPQCGARMKGGDKDD